MTCSLSYPTHSAVALARLLLASFALALLLAATAHAQTTRVVAWGFKGQDQTSVPDGLSGVTAIAAGREHTVALKDDGTVVAWGNNLSGQTNVPGGLSGVTAVAAGSGHTVAVKDDGTVVAWGRNSDGQTDVPDGLTGVTAVAAGGNHTMALKDDGTVVAWGYNLFGQTNVPSGLSGVTAIAAGHFHTVALKDDGTVVAWGNNLSGQTDVPGGLSGVTAIAAGSFHTVALKGDGTVVAWGWNESGQTDVPGGLGVTAIAAGSRHTVALKDDGTVVAWGENSQGQASAPDGLSGVTAIDAGNFHTVALAPNQPPTANAGPDQTVLVGQTVTLDGSASSDLEGDPLTYAWTLNLLNGGGAIALSDPTAARPIFVAAQPGFYIATLLVNDGTDDSVLDVVNIEVVNTAPIADAGPDQSVIAGQRVTLDGASSTDPDGDELTFAWTLDDASLSGADTASPMFCAADAGAYTAELVVNDGMADSAPDEVTVTAVSIDGTIEALIADIDALVAAGDLDRRFARSLTNRLTQARSHLDRGRSADAMFRTVRSRIGTLVRTGALSQTHADALTAALDAITGVLASPCSDTAAIQGDDLLASATIQAEVVFGLAAPYPNPTSGRATVAFAIEDPTDVRLAVYDALGREVAVLIEGAVPAGRHERTLDGNELVAGTYLVRLTTANGLAASHRLTLLR